VCVPSLSLHGSPQPFFSPIRLTPRSGAGIVGQGLGVPQHVSCAIALATWSYRAPLPPAGSLARGHDCRAEGHCPPTGSRGTHARQGPPSALALAARAVPPRDDDRRADARGLWAAYAGLREAACNTDRGIVLSFSCAVANRQGTEQPFLVRTIVGMSRVSAWVWVRQSESAQ
jgi:hypothetical protein